MYHSKSWTLPMWYFWHNSRFITEDLSFGIYKTYGHMTYKKVSCSRITLHFEDDRYEFIAGGGGHVGMHLQ